MTAFTPSLPRIRERDIHKAVIDLLDRFAHPDALYLHIPNEGKRDPRAGFRLKRIGLMPGAPDLPIWFRGRSYAMELKRPGGVQSPAQKAFAERFARAGGEYVVVDSVAGALAMLKHWGVVPGHVELGA